MGRFFETNKPYHNVNESFGHYRKRMNMKWIAPGFMGVILFGLGMMMKGFNENYFVSNLEVYNLIIIVGIILIGLSIGIFLKGKYYKLY